MRVQLLGTALSHLSPSLFVTQQSQPRTGALFSPDKTPNSLFSSVAGSWAIKDIQKNLELLTEGLGAGDLLPSGVLVSHSLMRLETPTFKPAVSCKGQASNVKGEKKKKLPGNSKQPQNTIQYYFMQHQSIADHYMDYFKENEPWTWYWKRMISGFLPPALPLPCQSQG